MQTLRLPEDTRRHPIRGMEDHQRLTRRIPGIAELRNIVEMPEVLHQRGNYYVRIHFVDFTIFFSGGTVSKFSISISGTATKAPEN